LIIIVSPFLSLSKENVIEGSIECLRLCRIVWLKAYFVFIYFFLGEGKKHIKYGWGKKKTLDWQKKFCPSKKILPLQ
jgi:hypothetical protein